MVHHVVMKNCLYSYKYLYPYGNPYRDHSQILISIGFESINKPKVNTYLSVLMYLRYWRQNKNKYKARFYTLRIYTTIGIAGLISNRGVTEPVANILLSWSQAACEKAQLFSAVLGAQTRRQYGWWKNNFTEIISTYSPLERLNVTIFWGGSPHK